jgi:hypothetical protein
MENLLFFEGVFHFWFDNDLKNRNLLSDPWKTFARAEGVGEVGGEVRTKAEAWAWLYNPQSEAVKVVFGALGTLGK